MKNNNKLIKTLVIVLGVLITVLISLMLVMATRGGTSSSTTSQVVDADATLDQETTEAVTELVTQTVNVEEVNTISLGVTGDVLIHSPILTGAYDSTTDTYDFSSLFSKTTNYIANCDYFVANLEVTLGGTDDGKEYSTYPLFNTPDALAYDLYDAGIDMLLTSNNHCYDSGYNGIIRTQTVLETAGLDYTGTQLEADDDIYTVVDIDGVQVGMLCYTYETDEVVAGNTYINGLLVSEEGEEVINSFSYYDLDTFYAEVKTALEDMEADGAMASVVYLHWGDEYSLEENSYQNTIAQKLCDLGVDVIVGGHPHVVQPMELVTSTDGTHSTVVAYSLGNAVSNQRRAYMDLQTGHTEDGMFLKLSFTEYNDGTALLTSVEVTPTWVDMYYEGSSAIYNVIALGEVADESNSITATSTSSSLSESYDRTMAIVGEGLDDCNEFLTSRAAEKLTETFELESEIVVGEEIAA